MNYTPAEQSRIREQLDDSKPGSLKTKENCDLLQSKALDHNKASKHNATSITKRQNKTLGDNEAAERKIMI